MQATYKNHMGTDLDVVNAARVSFKNESKWREYDGHNSDEFKLEERDAKLIYYLARHKHLSPFNHWRKKAIDKKQGSGGNMELSLFRKNCINNISSSALTTYKELIKDGVAPEMARTILPQNMLTEWIWSGTLGAFAKMCNLRCTYDTQAETRFIADSISTILGGLFPVSWNALMAPEVKAIQAIKELEKREKKLAEMNKFWRDVGVSE